MSAESEIKELITRYVLGELSEPEERSIEDKYALDPDFSELVNAAEDDLVDAYVLNRLSPQKREQFARFFLASPENRDKVTFTEVLLRHMEQDSMVKLEPASSKSQISAPLPPPSAEGTNRFNLAARFALAVILLAAVASGLLLFTKNRNTVPSVVQGTVPTPPPQSDVRRGQSTVKSQNNQTATSQPAERNGQSSNRQVVPRSTHKPVERSSNSPIIATFILTPGVTRALGDINTIEIPQSVETVELKLSIDSTTRYTAYQASLQQTGVGEIWTKRIRNDKLRARRSITLKVPVAVLNAGGHLMTITGTTSAGESEVAGDYLFIVLREK